MEYDVLHEAGGRQLIVVQSPTLDDVMGALEALDQESRTALTLIDGAGAYISVSGGRGRFHVYIGAFDHEDRVILQSPASSEPEAPAPVAIVSDGQATSHAPHEVVDHDTAREALTEFHRTGRPHLGLTWQT